MVSEVFIEMLLHDATAYSTIRRNKNVKKTAMGGRAAVDIAKQKRDPLYNKYERFRKEYLSYKKAIMRKYGRRGYLSARKNM